MSNINQWVNPIMDNIVSKMKQYGRIKLLTMQILFCVCSCFGRLGEIFFQNVN